jgi:hypothetical protein
MRLIWQLKFPNLPGRGCRRGLYAPRRVINAPLTNALEVRYRRQFTRGALEAPAAVQ